MLARIGCFKNYGFQSFKLKAQIPYYYPLNQWLLGATNGNQGQIVMDL